jgi:hypothetical protein
MSDFIVTSRAPISTLNLPNSKETSQILDNFDMFREVCTGMMRDALNFGYLEHLMRISTSEAETAEALRQFPRTLQYKLTEIIQLKKDLAQEIIHVLETKVTKEDVKLVKVNMIHINHRWDGRRVTVEEFEEGIGKLLPVCYTLTMKNRYYLLYTPNMSYIDGYEAFDGSVKINYIPESTLPQLTAEFYKSPSNKAVQTEEAKKKKKEDLSKNSKNDGKGILTPRQLDVNPFKDPENKSIIVSSGRQSFDEPDQSLFDQRQVVEEENESEQDFDEEDEEDEDESYDGGRPARKQRIKLVKTWEKYEKKAAYQKRDESFNPCDCLSF